MSKTRTPEEVAQRAGSEVASILEERGLTTEWLANTLDIEPAELADNLRNGLPVIVLFDIADALGVSVDRVLPVHA